MEDVLNGNQTELRPLPEKPHIDCGTVTVNTECRVEIPPRDSPFRFDLFWGSISVLIVKKVPDLADNLTYLSFHSLNFIDLEFERMTFLIQTEHL